MAIDIRLDLTGNPEPPTIILANRNGNRLGQLKINNDSISLCDKFNDASEISFTLNKYVDGKLNNLWDSVVDFKLIYCNEWDCWFEIKVELDESTETVKTVFCTQLGQAELSQIMLYNIEINSENDSNWDKRIKEEEYKKTVLYNPDDISASLLHRLLDKAPHYSIHYVDSTIKNIQRTFSFDDISIYDAFQEIAEEIGCLFVFRSGSYDNGKIQRLISVYDLQQNCNKCGYRGEFTDKCPNIVNNVECGSADITYGYGEDTLIFVTSDELAASGIQLVTDTDSVKNCFKLEAGDDLMTATVRNCNPNGTDYIWYFSDSVKEDMSDDLVDKLDSYNELYNKYYNEHISNLDINLVNKYNSYVEKYKVYKEDLQTINASIIGYSELMKAYYNVVDLSLYLKSGLMPTVKISDTNAEEQVKLLETYFTTPSPTSPPPVAVSNLATVSLSTANSAVLSMAKAIIKSTYKVDVLTSELIVNGNNKTWSGTFSVKNYSDEENDNTVSNVMSIKINDDLETFIQQKIDKALNKEDSEDLSISGLFSKNYSDFCNELKKYALKPLNRFYEACDTCIGILAEQRTGEKDSDLYDKLYVPYANKRAAIEAEIKVRSDEINDISGGYGIDGKSESGGLQNNIEKCKSKIQDDLNFQDYLGNELWLEYCTYRREDKYSNDNYISDGLNNAKLFERALEFFEVAKNEIYKSSELQHSISTTLKNLLAIPKFKDLIKYFKVGNWIRVQVDDRIYRLRLIEYEIDYGSFENISVEFSDVIKIKSGISDVKSVLSQVSSMSTSYDSVKKQSIKGNEASNEINRWVSDGLNSALIEINNNETKDISFDESGLLCRLWDDIEQQHSPKQLKFAHNIMAYTDDNWNSVRLAIGEHDYNIYDKSSNSFINKTGYGISADFVTAGVVNGSQIIGGDIYSDNYSISSKTGSYLNLRDGTFSFGGGSLRFEGGKLLISSPNVLTTDQITEINEEYLKTATVYAENLQVGSANIVGELNANQINTVGLIAENISGTTITGKTISGGIVTGATITGGSLEIGDLFSVDINGNVIANNLRSSNASITGGSLLIGNKSSGNYAEITSGGILNCNGANIKGSINGSTITGSDITGGSFTSMSQYNDGVVITSGEQKFYYGGTQIGSMFTGDGVYSISTLGSFNLRVHSDKNMSIDAGNGQSDIYITGNIYINGIDLETYIRNVIY